MVLRNYHAKLLVLLLGCGFEASFATVTQPEAALWPGESNEKETHDTERKAYKLEKGAAGKFSSLACQKAQLAEIARIFDKSLKMAPLLLMVCEHVTTGPVRVEAALRWGQASPALHEAERQLKKRLVKDLFPFKLQGVDERSNAWAHFVGWVNELALETDLHELRALAGVTQEAQFWETKSTRLDGVALPMLLQNVWAVIDSYCRAGRFEDAQRAFGALLGVEYPTSSGRFPVRHFFDTQDYRLVSQGPEPGLRVLPAPIMFDAADSSPPLLNANLVKRLLADWPALAEEAKSVSHLLGRGDKQRGDAYPTIATGGQWTRLDIYDVSGWRADLCGTSLKQLCGMLKGVLRSEGARAKQWTARKLIDANDETVGLFGVRPGGWASLHSGQDRRVNIHLCLVNCNSSRIVVSGKNIPYHDGSLFAFEDRAQHEVLNEAPAGGGDRINLVIGILHPDFDPDKEPKRRSQGLRLDWWISLLKEGLKLAPHFLHQAYFEAMHAQDVAALKYLTTKGLDVINPPLQQFRPLHEAAALGHTRIVKALLEMGVKPRTAAPGEPLHYAAHSGHLPMVKLLVTHGAVAAPNTPGISSPLDLARSQGHTAVVNYLATQAKAPRHHLNSGEL